MHVMADAVQKDFQDVSVLYVSNALDVRSLVSNSKPESRRSR